MRRNEVKSHGGDIGEKYDCGGDGYCYRYCYLCCVCCYQCDTGVVAAVSFEVNHRSCN